MAQMGPARATSAMGRSTFPDRNGARSTWRRWMAMSAPDRRELLLRSLRHLSGDLSAPACPRCHARMSGAACASSAMREWPTRRTRDNVSCLPAGWALRFPMLSPRHSRATLDHVRAAPEPVQVDRPFTHHLPPLLQVIGTIVGSAKRPRLAMGQLSLDDLRIDPRQPPPSRCEPSRESRAPSPRRK